MIKKYLPGLEKKLISLIARKRVSIVLYFLILALIFTLYFVPYLNLYITSSLIFFLSACGFLVVFQISIQKVAYLMIFLFFVSAVLFLLRDYYRAEMLINFVYGSFFITIISNLLKLRRKS